MSDFHLPDPAAMAAARLEALAKGPATAPQVEMWRVTDQNGQVQTLPALQVVNMGVQEGIRLLLALHERLEGVEKAIAEIHFEATQHLATEDAPEIPDSDIFSTKVPVDA
jgi:hypothetical protein